MPPTMGEPAGSDDCFEASFSDRDIILYALSIGFGGDKDSYVNDLVFLWEANESFAVFPTFYLALVFWARREHIETSLTQSLPEFPPPLMIHTGILPRRFLKKNVSVDGNPLLHTFQSITWMGSLAAPKRGQKKTARIQQEIVDVCPKTVGTFVTTKTVVANAKGDQVCVIMSTVLVLGISSKLVIPFTSPEWIKPNVRANVDQAAPDHQVRVTINHNAALLYRLSSGDTNGIHVYPAAIPQFQQKRGEPSLPLLHGLCTFGIVARILLQKLNDGSSLQHMAAEFTKPVMVQDRLDIRFWKPSRDRVWFQVWNETTGELVLRNGCAIVVGCPSNVKDKSPMSRL